MQQLPFCSPWLLTAVTVSLYVMWITSTTASTIAKKRYTSKVLFFWFILILFFYSQLSLTLLKNLAMMLLLLLLFSAEMKNWKDIKKIGKVIQTLTQTNRMIQVSQK